MSYDLHFVPKTAGLDAEAVRAFLEEGEANPTLLGEMSHQELAAVLQERNPALERFKFDFEEIARLEGVSVDEARRRHNHVELNASEKTGIQITLFPQQASIAVPYWHAGSIAEKVFAEVQKYSDILTEHGHFRIFDPQLERVVDSFDDLQDAVLRTYGGVVERMPDIVTESAKPKPWWRFW